MKARLPDHEAERLVTLHEHRILDTAPTEEFDDLVRLAAHLCGAPIAAVSLIDEDRQWFKAITGLNIVETPLDAAFCAHTILQPNLLVVPDTQADPRFADNPMVTGDPHIRFYAGVPLVSEEGHALGSLCVFDRTPRQMTAEQAQALELLARQVSSHLRAARRAAERERLIAERERLVAERERLVAEREWLEAERRRSDAVTHNLQGAVMNTMEGITLSDARLPDLPITYANPAFFSLTGYAAHEVIGRSCRFLQGSETDPAARREIRQALEAGRACRVTLLNYRKDDSTFWNELNIAPIRDTAGVLTHFVGIQHDITALKETEAALRESNRIVQENEAVLRAVLESAPVILYATDAAGTVTLSEGTGLSALGLMPGEGVGRSVFEFGNGDEENDAYTRRALAGETVSYDAQVHGLYLHTELRPLRDSAGTVTGITGVCFDVTARMQAEEQTKSYAVVLEFQKQELEKANAELASLATTDGLTGLYNHRSFQERLVEEVSCATRYGTPLSLILLDVDRFKQFNDAYGHPAGDTVLRTMAHILQACIRETDLVARYGGEEFVLILPQTDIVGAATFTERLRAAVEDHAWPVRSVTASFGVATLRLGEEGGAKLIARADRAMYQSKSAGRNRVTCASSTSASITDVTHSATTD